MRRHPEPSAGSDDTQTFAGYNGIVSLAWSPHGGRLGHHLSGASSRLWSVTASAVRDSVVFVAMMDVRPVGVGVHEPPVGVGVAVPDGWVDTRVLVEVVAVVVSVAVNVLRRLVDVLVSVLAPEERPNRRPEQDAGSRMGQPEGLAQ